MTRLQERQTTLMGERSYSNMQALLEDINFQTFYSINIVEHLLHVP